MKHNGLLATGTLSVWIAISATSTFANPGATVTIRSDGKPLSSVVDMLSTTEKSLRVSPELKDVKALILVRQRPKQQVLDEIAEVFGAEWVLAPDKGSELRRIHDVAKWKAEWKKARTQAVITARNVRTARTRKYMDDLINAARKAQSLTEDPASSPPGGIASVTLTRFLGMLSQRDRDALARAVSDGSQLHAGGEFVEVPCPFSYRFRELTRQQQDALRRYVQEAGIDRISEFLDQSRISFRILDFIKLEGSLPDGRKFGDWVMVGKVREDEVEDILHQSLIAQIARTTTPHGAVLGSKYRVTEAVDPVSGVKRNIGTCEPVVDLKHPVVQVSIPKGDSTGYTLPEIMSYIHTQTGLDIVSDYHNRGIQFKPEVVAKPIPLTHLLNDISNQYECVFKARSGFLKGRNYHWPDRDEEEVPYHLMNEWIAAKRTAKTLNLSQISALSRIPAEQQNAVAVYDDGTVSLSREVEFIRQQRPLVSLLSSLNRLQKNQLESKSGLPIRMLKSAHLGRLIEAWKTHAEAEGRDPSAVIDPQRTILWLVRSPAGQMSIYALVPGQQPFWEARIPFGRPTLHRL